MTLRDCITPNPTAVTTMTPLSEALIMMNVAGLRHLPVVDDHRKFLGLVSRFDVEMALTEQDPGLSPPGLDEIIELGSPTLSGSESVDYVWGVLGRAPGLSPLPVVQEGRLVGTVSQHNLLRAMAGLPPQREKTSSATLGLLSEWAERSAPGASDTVRAATRAPRSSA